MASSEIVRAQHSAYAISPHLEIGDDGLVWGLRSILVHMRKADGGFELALGEDRERLFAMLSAGGYRPPDLSPVFGHLQAASKFWRAGDKALANLRLVFARLPHINKAVDAYRVALAEHLLDQGVLPRDLLAELDLAIERLNFSKYLPDQPRVPAGNGVESGRWQSWPDQRGEGAREPAPFTYQKRMSLRISYGVSNTGFSTRLRLKNSWMRTIASDFRQPEDRLSYCPQGPALDRLPANQ